MLGVGEGRGGGGGRGCNVLSVWPISRLKIKIQNTSLSLSRNCICGASIHNNKRTHKLK